MVVFTLISAPSPSIYITLYLLCNVIVTGSLMFIISGTASMIHTTTVKSYHKLNLIYVAYGRFYDNQTRNRLICIIESISDPNKPISFYCHDIFPFRKTSIFQVIFLKVLKLQLYEISRLFSRQLFPLVDFRSIGCHGSPTGQNFCLLTNMRL